MKMSSDWNQSSTLEAGLNLPKVMYSPGAKSLISPWMSVLRPPSLPIRGLRVMPPMKPPLEVLWQMMDSGPFSWIVSMMASAISVRACSQEMRFHLPWPRSPDRLRGWRTRSLAYSIWLHMAPFWQPMGFMSGTPCSTVAYVPACSSRQTSPSLTYTRKGQLPG